MYCEFEVQDAGAQPESEYYGGLKNKEDRVDGSQLN